MTTSLASLDQACSKSSISTSCSLSTIQDIGKEKSQNQSFKNLTFLKKISKAKFPVYLVSSSSTEKQYAMKVFPFSHGKPSARYENECRFSMISHPNVVSMVSHNEEEEATLQEKTIKISYILMEYAPHGDFFDFVMGSEREWSDKLVRTYFHQLIEGVEHLHSLGIAHLDLKLENLLVGEDHSLKIADFDLAHFLKDARVKTKGTKHYRSPELLEQRCDDPQAADVYSAGIILFVMKCGGVLPHLEDQLYKGIHLCDLLHNKPDEFWEKHCKIQKRDSAFFNKDFQSLFISMTRPDPIERATITDIKNSQWYQGSTYSKEELSSFVRYSSNI